MIDKRKQLDEQYNTLVYIPDGESLGENGIAYLHGIPYRFAPEYQTKVPRHGMDYRQVFSKLKILTIRLQTVLKTHLLTIISFIPCWA